MTRLIDADKSEAYGTTVPTNCNAEDYLCGARDVLEHIDSMPTVDAVPVIRCKDCKYNYGNKYECDYNHEDIVCTYWMSDGLTDYDFCSMAEEYKE